MDRVLDGLIRVLRRVKRATGRLPRLMTRRQSVWVYQMGKVASSSVYRSLRQIPRLEVHHAHRINPENIRRVQESHRRRGMAESDDRVGAELHRQLTSGKAGRDIRIITLIREPVGRNVSAFFQNLDVFEKTDAAHRKLKLPQLIADFIDQYDHDTPLDWFDREMKPVTGIDVFTHPFDRKQGWQEIHSGMFHLLILRHDLHDELKQERIAAFLGIPPFRLLRMNEGSGKAYSQAYRDFLDQVTLPEEYVEGMLESRYAQHFFSDEERRRLRARWAQP